MDNLDQIREQNRWNPDNENQEVSESETSLTRATMVFMVYVALIIDLVQAILLYLIAGIIVDTFIGIFAGFTFWLWFKMHDVSFVTPKQIAAMGGGFFVELIPALNALPTWTFAVVYVIMTHKALEVADKAPGGRVVRIATQANMAGVNAQKTNILKNTPKTSSVGFAGKHYAGTQKPMSIEEARNEAQMTPEQRKQDLKSKEYTEWQNQMTQLNKVRRVNNVKPNEKYYNSFMENTSNNENLPTEEDSTQ
jgi:hypothetical protein